MLRRVTDKGIAAIGAVLTDIGLPEFEVLRTGWQDTIVARVANRMSAETPLLVAEDLVAEFAKEHPELVESMAIIELAKLKEQWELGPKRLGS